MRKEKTFAMASDKDWQELILTEVESLLFRSALENAL